MIGCDITGGLGNQFFRYAIARKLLEARKSSGIDEDFLINDYDIDLHGGSGSLFDFNIIQHRHVHSKRMVMEYGTAIQKMLYTLYAIHNRHPFLKNKEMREWFYKRLGISGLIISDDPDHETLYLPSTKTERIFTHGSFENPVFFEGIGDILKKEFTPLRCVLDYNKKLYDVITHSNSVFLGVRRGDFMQGDNRKIFYVCDLTYYKRAVEYMQTHIPDPVFIVFSNDIPWVKANLKIDAEVYYESGHDPVWETFRLMYSCRHFIISNSTLHWWAQFRSESPDKTVVAPERWYNAPGWLEHLMMPYFIRLETGVENPFTT